MKIADTDRPRLEAVAGFLQTIDGGPFRPEELEYACGFEFNEAVRYFLQELDYRTFFRTNMLFYIQKSKIPALVREFGTRAGCAPPCPDSLGLSGWTKEKQYQVALDLRERACNFVREILDTETLPHFINVDIFTHHPRLQNLDPTLFALTPFARRARFRAGLWRAGWLPQFTRYDFLWADSETKFDVKKIDFARLEAEYKAIGWIFCQKSSSRRGFLPAPARSSAA